MDYYDKELLEAKRTLEREKFTTVESGIYAGEELITFTKSVIPDSTISMWLPNSFVLMPKEIKNIKYPSINAPHLIVTSLDFSINIGIDFMLIALEEGDIKEMINQFQTAIKNVNPAIKVLNRKDKITNQGNKMSWFDFVGYHVDGQSYNITCLVKLRSSIFHGIFNCKLEDQEKWDVIAKQIFETIEEEEK